MKERYDSGSQGKILEHGDAVWLFNPQRKKGVTPKLARTWKTPYTVVKGINDIAYRIQFGLGQNQESCTETDFGSIVGSLHQHGWKLQKNRLLQFQIR